MRVCEDQRTITVSPMRRPAMLRRSTLCNGVWSWVWTTTAEAAAKQGLKPAPTRHQSVEHSEMSSRIDGIKLWQFHFKKATWACTHINRKRHPDLWSCMITTVQTSSARTTPSRKGSGSSWLAKHALKHHWDLNHSQGG